jgi:membrane protease YdiL (CAAX protease family)
MVFVYHAFSFTAAKYLIPVYLAAIPLIFQKKINLRLTIKDIITGIAASVVILLPFIFFFSLSGKVFTALSINTMLFQLLGVSFPEEIYFRGFLQERLGNNIRSIFIASILFSTMHIPQFIFYNDIYPLLTFFPSLIMGLLYLKTSNILPSAVFHFFSNIVFLGFYDIL